MGYLSSSTFLLKGKYGEGISVLIGLIAFIWEAMKCVNWKMESPCKESSDDLLFILNRVCACSHLWMFIIFHTDFVSVLFCMRNIPTPHPRACSIPSSGTSLEGGHRALCCPQEGEAAEPP